MTDLLKRPPGHWAQCVSIMWPPGSGNVAATSWDHRLAGLKVLRSVATDHDGSKWIHVSVSRSERLPTWDELVKVKIEFIGPEREAYQVLARDRDHVNIHNYCLHLWSPLDGRSRVANLQTLTLEVGA